MDHYHEWVRAVVEHYYPLGIRYYQIGNEVWNIGHNKFWCSDLDDYEDLLLEASQAITLVAEAL